MADEGEEGRWTDPQDGEFVKNLSVLGRQELLETLARSSVGLGRVGVGHGRQCGPVLLGCRVFILVLVVNVQASKLDVL